MKFRVTFVHGIAFEYEAATVEDDGITMTLRDAVGALVASYQDSDLASCVPIDPAGCDTDGTRLAITLPDGDQVIHAADGIDGGPAHLTLADASGRGFACYRNHGFETIEPA